MAAERYERKALPLKYRPCEEGRVLRGGGDSQGRSCTRVCAGSSGQLGKAKSRQLKEESMSLQLQSRAPRVGAPDCRLSL